MDIVVPALRAVRREAEILHDISSVRSLSEILRPVASELEKVESILGSAGRSGEGILKESSAYVLEGGGKRIRASMVLLASAVTEKGFDFSRITPQTLQVAAAVELVHAATLVHDDILDRAAVRRMKPAANVRFGEDVAVLLGDFLFARAFRMVVEAGDPVITARFAETAERTCAGEMEQLKNRWRADLPMADYLSLVERKTAALISFSAFSGGRLAELGAGEMQALESFGSAAGTAFQMVDDILDIVGNEASVGKTLRTDAENGKMTLPLILLYEEASAEDRDRFVRNFKSGSPDWPMIRGLCEKYGTIVKAGALAEQTAANAVSAIDLLHPSVRKTLEDLARFLLLRDR